MKKIIGIGNALVDVMTRIDDDKILSEFGLPKGSMQLVDAEKSELIRVGTSKFNPSHTAGGSAANTIHGLGMLGAEVSFIGSISKDDIGKYFTDDMKRAGVQPSLKYVNNFITGTSTVMVSPDSERTMATHLGAAIELNENDINENTFKGYDILYLEGYLIPNKPLFEKACKLAEVNNMEVAVDMASYNVVEENLMFFKEILEKYVDIVFANEEEARALTGKNAEEALDEISSMCNIAVVKIGDKGSLIKRDDELLKIGSMDVKSIDTTGAGDLYASGFLYAYSTGKNLEQCGLTGTLLAGNVIEVVGAKMDTARWEKIKTAIKEIEEV